MNEAATRRGKRNSSGFALRTLADWFRIGLQLGWEKTLQRVWPAELEFTRATPQFKLPVILSASEVRTIITKIALLDHRVALTTIYSCGLRLGEALKLEVGDIDSKRMFLHIRAGKGNRDRYVPLPQRTLEFLRELWRTHWHPRFLFPAKGHIVVWALPPPTNPCAAPRCNEPSVWLSVPAASKRPFTSIRCATATPSICWSKGRTSANSRSTSAITAPPPPSSIPCR